MISLLYSCKSCRGCELYIVFRIHYITDYGVYLALEFVCWYDIDTYILGALNALLPYWIHMVLYKL